VKGFFRLIPLGFFFVLVSLVLATACAGLNDPSLPLAQLGSAPAPFGACLPHHYLIGGIASDGGDGSSSPSQNSVVLSQCSATPTVTGTKTPTPTKTTTVTSSATATKTSVGTSTATPTGTRSATSTPTLTKTPTATATGTQQPTATSTKTSTPTPTQPTSTPTQTATPTPTPTQTSCMETPGTTYYSSGGDPNLAMPTKIAISPYDKFCPGDTITYTLTVDSPTPVQSVSLEISMDHTEASVQAPVPSCAGETECVWTLTFTARTSVECVRNCGLPGQMLTAPDTNSQTYGLSFTLVNGAGSNPFTMVIRSGSI
jgi:hypothetical protein